MVPFSNGRREGANPSSRVIVLLSLKSQTFVVDQLCYFKLGISVPSLRTRVTDHTRTEKIDGDSIFIFVINQVMTKNRYDMDKSHHLCGVSISANC